MRMVEDKRTTNYKTNTKDIGKMQSYQTQIIKKSARAKKQKNAKRATTIEGKNL